MVKSSDKSPNSVMVTLDATLTTLPLILRPLLIKELHMEDVEERLENRVASWLLLKLGDCSGALPPLLVR